MVPITSECWESEVKQPASWSGKKRIACAFQGLPWGIDTFHLLQGKADVRAVVEGEVALVPTFGGSEAFVAQGILRKHFGKVSFTLRKRGKHVGIAIAAQDDLVGILSNRDYNHLLS
jgi:hypothetical protein